MLHQHATVDYLLHGYTIRSSIVLAAPLSPRGEPPALEVMSGGRRVVPWSVPDRATRLASVNDDRTRSYYSCFRHQGQVVVRFHGACEVVLSDDLTTAVVYVDPAADEGISSVVVTGALMALRLLLDGELILHASAVEIDGSVIAFVGASGMGKSTLATLLCGYGGQLVTDDVLRVTFGGNQPHAWPGATESRLRPGADALQHLFDGPGRVRITADGRTAVTPPVSQREWIPLRVCVVPLPDRTLGEVRTRVLDPVTGMLTLLRFPRIPGWEEPQVLARQFELTARLVETVRVVEARVPWGPPFPPLLAEELAAALV